MEMRNENVNELLLEDELLEVMSPVALSKGLEVFTFKEDELEMYYPQANPAIGVALMSKNLDGAIWNLKNQRRLLLFRTNQ